MPNERSKQADLFWNLAVLYKQQKNWLAARNAYQQALSYYQLDSQKFSLT
ncbi:hypothetical protein [Candidatus Venteria ishoeyi]|nr:hypothetical protein [Candidatus Venteria ishoeyi]